MELEFAALRLSALGHPMRLAAFQALAAAGPDGLAAGALARATGAAPSTLSAHLGRLAAAGLVTSRREGRSIIYSAACGAAAELMAFLLEQACAGRTEVNLTLGRAVIRAAEGLSRG